MSEIYVCPICDAEIDFDERRAHREREHSAAAVGRD